MIEEQLRRVADALEKLIAMIEDEIDGDDAGKESKEESSKTT